MGAFNSKDHPTSSASIDIPGETSKKKDILESAVSQISPRNDQEILNNRTPHGLATFLPAEQTEAFGQNEIKFDVVFRQSSTVPNAYEENYLHTNLDDSFNVNEEVQSALVTTSTLQSEQIPLQFKGELFEQSQDSKDTSTELALIPNPFADIGEKGETVEASKDLKHKIIKRELIEENTVLLKNNKVNKFELFNLLEDIKLEHNPSADIETQKLSTETDIKQELIEENFKESEALSKGDEPKKTSRWITNPFSLITSITKEYACRRTVEKNSKVDIKKEALPENNKLTISHSKLLANPFAKIDQSNILKEIKCESSALECESDRFSDYYSLCNTSFDSLPKIENTNGSQCSEDQASNKWMVKLPEEQYTANKKHINRSTFNKISSEKRKPNKKCEVGNVQNKEFNISKPKHVHKPKPKIARKPQSNAKYRRKITHKNKSSLNDKGRKKQMRRGRRRKNETDKTYSCSIPINVTHSKMPLRARKNEKSINKQIPLFPKPLLDEKPQVVPPPAPIQIIKLDRRQSTNELKQCVDENQLNKKIEIDCLNNVNNSLEMPVYELTSTSKSPKFVKLETDHYRLSESTSQASTLNVKRKRLPLTLGNNCKLIKSLQPKVLMKRLSLPANVCSSHRDNPCFKKVKKESLTQFECHRALKSLEALPNIEPKRELTPLNEFGALNMLSLGTPNVKLLQSIQPKVCVKRFLLPQDVIIPKTETQTELEERKPTSQGLLLYTPQSSSVSDYQHKFKFLQSMQPKVRLKRLKLHEGTHRSQLINVKQEVDRTQTAKLHFTPIPLNLQPLVRLRRLKFADINDFKFQHCTYLTPSVENYTKQLKVDLEVKRECNFYEESATYKRRKHNECNVRIKEEKLSPKRTHQPSTSTPILRIDRAFSLQPRVRVKRLKCMSIPLNANAMELKTEVKMEYLEVDEEQLTPISFAKQYDEEDSGVSLDSAQNNTESFVDDEAGEETFHTTDNILFEIALQRACINDLLMQSGYSPMQFKLYNNIEELKIVLDYLLVK